LIELLVVLLIIGALLGLLLPAVLGARTRMQATVCQNNVYQLSIGLREFALADAMNGSLDPNADFPRPPLLRCPMQEDFPSRVPHVGFSHYLLTVDRPIRGKPEKVRWDIHDRELLVEGDSQEPWYLAPELTFFGQQSLFANKPGPHPPGLYMTVRGLYSAH
jgi:hypothetical protein